MRGFLAVVLAVVSFAAFAAEDVVIANSRFRLVVGADAVVKSLKLNGSAEELLDLRAPAPLFQAVQARPYNNEIKLIHPNKRTVYPANSLRREGNRLVVGFQTITYEAAVELDVKPDYVVFRLAEFLVDREDYDYLKMDTPPTKEFRVLSLPVRNRRNFGDWLNCAWDESAAVCVAGTSPFAIVSHDVRDGYRVLYADLLKGKRLKGGSAALIAASGREPFLDCMDAFERDLGLPRGVKNRRNPLVCASIYHESGGVTPLNADRTIALAKAGGFRCVTLSYASVVKHGDSWRLSGDYDFRDEYPNGCDDLRAMLKKFHEAGLKVGIHTFHPHVGLDSRYVTPRADPRLSLTRRFTLRCGLPAADGACDIEVYEPTVDTVMFEPCRVLKFGTELISYESYTTEPPYVFRGCRRGAWNTDIVAHPAGEMGGILDISEFGTPKSCYVDQDNDLQDEIAEKIAKIYNCGFDYIYMDGSEGVNEPFDINVGYAQHRVWKRLSPEPFCAEGAAKVHFSWHMLAGANAFDTFPAHLFKEKLLQFPCSQAPLSWQDMTRVDFGWWYVGEDMKPDILEFGEAKATGWGCCASFLINPDVLDKHPQKAELLATVRRWEDAKAEGFFTPEIKARLRNPAKEHHLIRNSDGSFELKEFDYKPNKEK